MQERTRVRPMFRVLEAGENLGFETPWLRENPEEARRLYDCALDRLRFRVTPPQKPPVESEFQPAESVRIPGAQLGEGAHEVEIFALQEDGEERSLWKQLVFRQTPPRRTPERIDELARRYAPIFLFSRKEDYFPVSLNDLLRHPTLLASAGHVEVKGVMGEERISLGDLDEFLRYNGHCEYLLDQSLFDMDESAFLEIKGEFRKSVVYYSYLEDSARGRFFINYHTFYAFDPKTGIAKLLNVGPHIFDRESLTLEFGDDEAPRTLTLSGHMENQAILFLDRLKIWNTGRVSFAWPQPQAPAVENHPIVAVAEGSHALYPSAGLYHISALTELAGHVFPQFLPVKLDADEMPPEMDSRQALLPPALASERFANYELRPLRLDLLRSDPLPERPLYDPATAALVFSGYWVDVPGWVNERFPPFSAKEREVVRWIDEASPWRWDELPQHVHEHNRAIADYVEKNLNR